MCGLLNLEVFSGFSVCGTSVSCSAPLGVSYFPFLLFFTVSLIRGCKVGVLAKGTRKESRGCKDGGGTGGGHRFC